MDGLGSDIPTMGFWDSPSTTSRYTVPQLQALCFSVVWLDPPERVTSNCLRSNPVTISPRQELVGPSTQIFGSSASDARSRGGRVTYSVLKLDECVSGKMHTHAVSVVGLDLDTRQLAPGPPVLDRNFPKANVVAVGKGQHTGASVAGLQPGAPVEPKRGARGNPIRVQSLSRL